MSMPAKDLCSLYVSPEIQTHIPPCILYISLGDPTHTLNLAYPKLKSITKSLLPSSLTLPFTNLLLCLLCPFQLMTLLFTQPLRLEIIKSGLILHFQYPSSPITLPISLNTFTLVLRRKMFVLLLVFYPLQINNFLKIITLLLHYYQER